MEKIAKMLIAILLVCLSTITALAQQEEKSPLDDVQWQEGPGIGDLGGNLAEVHIPEGYLFADAHDTKILMEAMQNPVTGKELGFLAHPGENWFLVFEFDEVGYVKDNEKDSLDSAAMLESIIKGNEAANREREKRGWPGMKITGWQQEPHYNPSTNNLEWAIRGESESEQVINWNTRLLGRKGVMKVTLVAAPELLEQTLPYYQDLISGFDYKPGNRYSEFRQGDKISKYGLTALVVGGATAVAAKSGLLKYIWKILVVGFIAVAAFFKRLFSGRKNQGGAV